MATQTAATNSIEQLFEAQRRHQDKVKRSSADDRITKLARLRAAIVRREQAICNAVFEDFKKSPTESMLTEIFPALSEIKDAIKHVGSWMKPEKVSTPITLLGTKSWIHYEPKGVVLIIGPWNYPFQLIIAPLIAAIAAGNCVICKPSELTPATSKLLAELIADVFPPEEVAVVEGGVPETTRLLALPFDHFFFTGSSAGPPSTTVTFSGVNTSAISSTSIALSRFVHSSRMVTAAIAR